GAVEAEAADLRPGEERERDVLEDLPLGRNDLAHAVHREDVLSHGDAGRERPEKTEDSEVHVASLAWAYFAIVACGRAPPPGQAGKPARSRLSRWCSRCAGSL